MVRVERLPARLKSRIMKDDPPASTVTNPSALTNTSEPASTPEPTVTPPPLSPLTAAGRAASM
ncbi:MAG: hypothetical protein JW976_15425 [Syntrophaceae bacterium]|nr:hypothetical protein [Syntrophaceae bacterium]